MSRRNRWRRKSRALAPAWVFALSISLGLLAAWNTGNNLLYVVVGGLGSHILISMVLARRNLRHVEVKRESVDAVYRGEPFGVSVRIENHKRVVPAVSVRVESLSRPGESAAYVARIPAHRAAVVRMTEVFEKRGVHALPPVTLASTFPFGLLERRMEVDDEKEIVVYPRVVAVRAAVLEHLTGARQVPKMAVGDGTDFFSLREYVMGDDIRRIAWRASARMGRLVVKELVRETSRTVVFALDTARSDDEGSEDSFEQVIELVASLAVTLLNQHYTVSLLAPGVYLPPGEGTAQVYRVLETLARVESTEGTGYRFAWLASEHRKLDYASYVYASPAPEDWGERRGPGGARILHPKEVVRA